MERLLSAYQESLITLEELRSRLPELRKQQQAIEAELQSLEMAAVDQTHNLRLVETLTELRTRLHARANALAEECQRVVRLLIHEILVGRDSITIRHSIPMPALTPGARPTHEPPKPGPAHVIFCSHTVSTPETMFPDSGPVNIRFPEADFRRA
jgi:site-specific DNA recombinase